MVPSVAEQTFRLYPRRGPSVYGPARLSAPASGGAPSQPSFAGTAVGGTSLAFSLLLLRRLKYQRNPTVMPPKTANRRTAVTMAALPGWAGVEPGCRTTSTSLKTATPKVTAQIHRFQPARVAPGSRRSGISVMTVPPGRRAAPGIDGRGIPSGSPPLRSSPHRPRPLDAAAGRYAIGPRSRRPPRSGPERVAGAGR